MELKPTRKPGSEDKVIKPLQSIGAGGDNPWEVVNRGAVGAPNSKRQNWSRAALGATPPRDGPWAMPAQAVAGLLPPKTRARRKAVNPWPAMTGNKVKRRK